MYLLSLYIEEKAEKHLISLINKAALKSGNNFMKEFSVKPHITLAAFNTKNEQEVLEILKNSLKNIKKGSVIFPSIGVFKSSVIFLFPVLNKYLYEISETLYEALKKAENTVIDKHYIPFNWMPHLTIAKKLDETQLIKAFDEVQKNFRIIKTEAVRIEFTTIRNNKREIIWKKDLK